jgi:hypothetical protein
MILPLLYLAMLQEPTRPEFKGSWLYSACQGGKRFLDAPRGHQSDDDFSDFDKCSSYIAGFVEAGAPNACPPDEASLGTMLRLYVAYMDGHPKLLDEHRLIGLRQALREAYPCRSKGK